MNWGGEEMADITIYDSQGRLFGEGKPGPDADLISSAFRARLRVMVEWNTSVRMIVFFRAREFESGRAEQFFAVYRSSQSRDIQGGFLRALKRKVEDELGLTLVTDSTDVKHLRGLNPDNVSSTGSRSDFDQSVIETLLREGHSLRYGISDINSAMELFHHLFPEYTNSIVIAEDTSSSEWESSNMRLEVGGSHRGLKPLGATKELDQQVRERKQDQYVQSKIRVIREEINELQQETNLSATEIRRRLTTEIPALRSANSSGGASGRRGQSRRRFPLNRLKVPLPLRKIGLAVVSLVIVIALVIAIINGVAMFFGLVPGALEAIVFLDQDTEPTLEDVTVVDANVGEKPVSNVTTVNVSTDSALYVNGTTNQDEVKVHFSQAGADNGGTNVSVTPEVSDNEFSADLSEVVEELVDENADLEIEVGSDIEQNVDYGESWEVSIQFTEEA